MFLANTLLLNYLIAILSTTYESMKQNGIFRYKVNLYTYCEKYIVCFKDRGYGEMVLHPPPLTYVAMLYLVPVLFSSISVEKMSGYLSMTMYYFENIIFIALFFVAEIFMIVPLYIKVFFNIHLATDGARSFFYQTLWLVFGLPCALLIILTDTKNLFKVL